MALNYQCEIVPGTFYAIWKIDESIDELRSQLQLSEQEEQIFLSIHHDKRKRHWLSARALLRAMLNTNEPIDCRSDDQGKPYLVGMSYAISISHSFDYVAVMLSDKHQVGIDIEFIDQKIDALASKFLSVQELSFIDDTHRIEHLYACWCAKEAIFKLHGKHGVSLLNDISLNLFHYQNKGMIEANLLINNTRLVVHYEKSRRYMMSWVTY